MLKEIEEAQSSVLILSGWISDRVIDEHFMEALENALRNEVQIFLGFGFESSDGRHGISNPAKRALTRLGRAARDYQKNLHIGKFNNHQKVLVIDERRVVCGSHNWLSNREFRNREQSIVIKDGAAAKSVFLHSVPLILKNPAFDRQTTPEG